MLVEGMFCEEEEEEEEEEKSCGWEKMDGLASLPKLPAERGGEGEWADCGEPKKAVLLIEYMRDED